jgi:hypothetical protein
MSQPMKSPLAPQVSRPFPAADHHSARISDQTLHAEAFLAMFDRLRGAPDLESEFQRWADGKDFQPRDRLAIASEGVSTIHILIQDAHADGPTDSRT